MPEATYYTRSSSIKLKAPATNSNGIIKSFVASKKRYLVAKRCFDIVFSSIVIVLVLSWLLPVVIFLIKCSSRGPVFFRQKRAGFNGRPFKCLKLRTMVINEEADERPAEINDERITRIGKFLRRTNIDELPQFFNVFMGQMSIVGPRPHMTSDCIRFSFVISSYQFRHLMKPGITGLAQVKGHHGPTADYESIMLRYFWDAEYIRKAKLSLDLKIIGITIFRSIENLLSHLS
jgi:putative colanic acid biosynthesis UDP-glucose lipid carrier transferase